MKSIAQVEPASARRSTGVLFMACGIAAVLCWGLALVGVPIAAAADSACGPFDEHDRRVVQLAANFESREQGIAPAANRAGGGGPGRIESIPAAQPDGAASGGTPAAPMPSEALLALPKNGAGKIPDDFELGPGASIAESFFSPVICATVARVTGPAGATLAELVTVVPDSSVVVANDVYASAAAEIEPLADAPAKPDPYLSLQYGLAATGVREVRSLSNGEGVRVALLDSAPERAHADLSGARIREGDENRPAAGEWGGPEEAVPAGVHGTLMAGVIAAVEGNGFGIAGVAPGAEIVSIPVCTPSGAAGGQCTIYRLLQGFDQAFDSGAALVNLSFSGPPNPLLERGVLRLEELGLVVVAAAGNEGTEAKRYPAAYASVIGVGAVDRQGERFALSNFGSWVELYAPGVEVLSTIPGSAFAFGNGTSLSAAHVTGELAVLTSAMGDPKRARSALFRAAQARGRGGVVLLPTVCDALEGFALACDGGD